MADVVPRKPQDRTRALLRSRLEADSRLVGIAIADHMDERGEAWPSLETLAEETGYAWRTVQAIIAHGLAVGWLLPVRWLPGRRRVLAIAWSRIGHDLPPRNTPRSASALTTANMHRVQEGSAGPSCTGRMFEHARGDILHAQGAFSNMHGMHPKQTNEAIMKQTNEATIARASEDDPTDTRKADPRSDIDTDPNLTNDTTIEEDTMQLFGKEIPHPADTRIVDPPKAPPLPSWVPKDTKPYARADVAGMVLDVIAEVRRPADLAPDAPTPPVDVDIRCKVDAKTILALWTYLEHPPIGEFARDLIAVIRAARPGGCPDLLFARNIRGENWVGSKDRHRSLPTLCRRESWFDRLDVAREWAEHPERFAAEPVRPTKLPDNRDVLSFFREPRIQ